MQFLKKNSYNIVRLIVMQVGISVFALTVTFATTLALSKREDAQGPALLAVSIFSIGFYLMLIHSMVWEQGTKDKIRIEAGRMQADPFYGMKIALFAAIPNFIIAFLMLIGFLFSKVGPFAGFPIESAADNLYSICCIIGYFVEAMLQGVIQFFAGDGLKYWVVVLIFCLAPFLAVMTSYVSYRMGLKEKKIIHIKRKQN